MTPQQLFQAGKLQSAADAVTQELRSNPTDTARRTFLFELLCFLGQYERAAKQLDIVEKQDEQAGWAVQVYKNLLIAEQKRQALFVQGTPPEFLEEPPGYIREHLEVVRRWSQPDESLLSLLEQAETERPAWQGTCDGQPVDELRDCDDLLAPVLEFCIMQEYAWIPWDQISELEIAEPKHPRDLIWIPARVVFRGGRQVRGYVPVLYVDSYKSSDELLQLGRNTDWLTDTHGVTRGVGQRTVLVGDEAYGVLGLPALEATS